jgi:predicted acylesterase/phospholipase RssA
MATHSPGQPAIHPDEFDRLAVVTIQGGGVYGLNMLGQLAAVIDDYGITPLAYAGTSAGAVVAALSWAGYSPKEIRSLFVKLAVDGTGSKDASLASGAPRTVVDLLGPIETGRDRFEYGDFRRLAELAERSAGWIGSTLDPGATPSEGARSSKLLPNLVLGGSLLTFVIVMGMSTLWDGSVRSWVFCAGALFAIGSGWAFGMWQGLHRFLLLARTFWKAARHVRSLGYLKRGFFSGDNFEGFIDRCLKDSPRFRAYSGDLGDASLTFGWVDRLVEEREDEDLEKIVPLILTATNITTRELILIRSFDDRFHPLSVAKAVRASAGFPVFFRPVDLRCQGFEGWYVDGGMISNFPAWVFSRELRRSMAQSGLYRDLAIRPWLNLGLRVVPDRAEPAAPDERPSEFIRSLFDLARGQVRNELEKALAAQLPRAISILQPSSLTNAPPNLLDVDQLNNDKIKAMFYEGREFAEEELSRYSFTLPTEAEASSIEQALERVVNQVLKLFCKSNDVLKLRANVFVPREQKLVLAYSHGMAGDPDCHLEFDHDAGLTGFSFVNRRSFLCNLRYTRQWAEQAPSPDATLLGMNRAAHLSVREDRTWLASVPVFDPIDCWFLDSAAPRLERNPEMTPVWIDVPGTLDGAVFGVLNLDAAIDYGQLCLSSNPETSLTDPRISSILNSLQACSFEIGRIFSQAFARMRKP